ncbi:hypothetical protein E5676_scaffold17328G00010 [Cucumis melo var. makuwa]|nr:hypothetical protein E5676_scaffold17328G00010 [Cucumis melo var. makuwa]
MRFSNSSQLLAFQLSLSFLVELLRTFQLPSLFLFFLSPFSSLFRGLPLSHTISPISNLSPFYRPKQGRMEYSQVVRHRFLVPTCKGANPFTPDYSHPIFSVKNELTTTEKAVLSLSPACSKPKV